MSDSYDPQNIFAKILRGEAACVKIHEDEVSLSFMDIMPRAKGHSLVIPKFPARNIFDIPPDYLAKFMPAVQRIAVAAKKALDADGISVMQFNELAGGQIVFHLHFHVLPRWEGVALKPPGGPMVAAAELAPLAEAIRVAI